MAPRRARQKAGLTRVDAALDAMRPMGFSSDVVRKCVKNLLKVYGGDGWVFIEDSAYKLLIDTILEEPAPQLEYAPEPLPLEGCSSGGNQGLAEPVPQLCYKEVTDHEQASGLDIHQAEEYNNDASIKRVVNEERKLDVKVSLAAFQVAEQLGSLPANTTSQPTADSIRRNRTRKPCYGWISDDEDEASDFVLLTPANSTIGS